MNKLLFFTTIIWISFFKFNYAQFQWSCIGASGMPTNTFVVGFEYYHNDLYAYTYPNSPLYKLNTNNTWQAMYPVPLSNGIHRARVIDTTLYVAAYTTANHQYVYYLQNNAWQQMGDSFKNAGSTQTPNLYDIISFNNEIYVCGEFNRVGTDTVLGIAKWNGTKWIALGQGLSGKMAPNNSFLYPHNMMVHQNKLYVTGNFINAGGISVNGIAAWDGTSWSALGTGFNKVGYGMCEFNGELYAGGEFTQAGDTTVSMLAKWNGSNWQHPGLDFQNINSPGNLLFVHTLENINNTLYIGGGFSEVIKNGVSHSCGSIISYDGNGIDTMLAGVNQYVEGISLYQNTILVGGNFTIANNANCRSVCLYGNTTGTEEHATELQHYLVTTICKDYITIIDNSTVLNYTLTDLTGKEMQSGKASNIIALNQLANGYYILVLKDRKNIVQRNKIIIQQD